MSLQLTGRVTLITDAEQVSDRFSKQQIVIETEGQYPQQVAFDVINKPELLNPFSTGDRVTVSFDVRGREYQGKYYTSLNAWKVNAAN